MKEEIKYDIYTDVGTGFLERMMDKYRCKKCGHLGKMTIITNAPLDIICESCEIDEKIDSILEELTPNIK
jgi:hypothetical protein